MLPLTSLLRGRLPARKAEKPGEHGKAWPDGAGGGSSALLAFGLKDALSAALKGPIPTIALLPQRLAPLHASS
jgi:hypothetical protein